jgi:MarC family integral membrane protein
MWHEFLYAVGISVAAMFPIVNPIGHAPIFFAMTANDSLEFRRTQALKTSLWLIIILASSLLLGRWILEFFGITLDDLRIAGGLLVAHAAWGMLNNQSRMTLDEHTAAADKTDIAADGHANSGRPGLDESRPRHVDLWKHIDERRLSVWFRTDRPDDVGQFPVCGTARSPLGRERSRRSKPHPRTFDSRDRRQLDHKRCKECFSHLAGHDSAPF